MNALPEGFKQPIFPFHAVRYQLSERREGHVTTLTQGICKLTPEHEVIGEEALLYLNNALHHDGYWRIIFTDPVRQYHDLVSGLILPDIATEIEFQWCDMDDDPQFSVDVDHNPKMILDMGLSYYIASCEEGWQQYNHVIKTVEILPHQRFNQAWGEVAPSVLEGKPQVEAPDFTTVGAEDPMKTL